MSVHIVFDVEFIIMCSGDAYVRNGDVVGSPAVQTLHQHPYVQVALVLGHGEAILDFMFHVLEEFETKDCHDIGIYSYHDHGDAGIAEWYD